MLQDIRVQRYGIISEKNIRFEKKFQKKVFFKYFFLLSPKSREMKKKLSMRINKV